MKGLKQSQLAKELRISKSYLSMILLAISEMGHF